MTESSTTSCAAAIAPALSLAARFRQVRARTAALIEPLSEADCQVQSMPDASPAKWHLAHTSWFFETFVLEKFEAGFRPFDPQFRVLFNSYYNGIGDQHPRPRRGQITRPTLAGVLDYRRSIDLRVDALLCQPVHADLPALLELGLQHEQQHQELLLTDIQHLLSCNPLLPAYRPTPQPALPAATPAPAGWCRYAGGLVELGDDGGGFVFDNETPRHKHFLRPYALADRLVTQGEWLAFINDGGYRDARWWLSAGWEWARSSAIDAPLYWRRDPSCPGGWARFTLNGPSPLQVDEPVAHVSYFESDAYARWASAHGQGTASAAPLRLPTEAEWEHAAALAGKPAIDAGNLYESGCLQPRPAAPPAPAGQFPRQLFGDVWEWTSSAYQPYPGFRAWDGAVGEYNAKFMVNQQVLRGGSCVTPVSHVRASYRNFFPADARWQFTGLRLATDID